MSFKGSSGGHFVQRSGTNLAILLKAPKRNIYMIYFFFNLAIGLGGNVVLSFFFFFVLFFFFFCLFFFSSGSHFVQPS